MKRFSQFVVSEAVTAAATNTEMAICYHYNLKRTKDQKKALSDSGISDDNFKKLTPDLLKIGEKVASQMGDRGPMLIHSGASTANKNYYEGASDKTPKADFRFMLIASSKSDSLIKCGGFKIIDPGNDTTPSIFPKISRPC